MYLLARIRRRFAWLSLPGALLVTLLQRIPAINVVFLADEMASVPRAGFILRSVLVAAASLETVNTMVGATPLVPSSGTANGTSATVGTAVSIFYTVNGTQTPPASWSVQGNIPPGLDFSGLTSPGGVNVSSLHLEGTPTTAGTYTVSLQTYQFTDEGGISSPTYSYTITVAAGSGGNVAPSITTQPQSQTVTAGASVSFTGAASGTPTPTLQWQKNGSNISGATSATFSISSVATTDAGTYTLVATNTAGTVTSNGATLTVNAATSAPAITTQPQSQTVTVGGSVTFTGAASGNPTPTYQWQKNGTNISGATSATYSIPSVASTDAGSYTLVATNTAGSATSNAATLTVNAAATAPTITTQPQSQTVTTGASVTFTVVATGSPTPTYQWQKGGTNITGATSASYSISSVASADAATYTVVVSNSAGTVTSSGAVLTVSAATAAPTITTQPSSQTASVGASATFTVSASGNPPPTYQWQKGGSNISGATSSSFKITAVATTDAGTYDVVVTNSQGTVTSSNVTLTVTSTAANQVLSETVTSTHNATFSAGGTQGSIQWQISTDNGATWNNISNNSTYSGATTNTLTVANAGSSLNGDQYRYVATNNGVVSTSNGATLTVAQVVLPFPTCIAVDASGNLYVGDQMNDTVNKVTSAGQVSLLAGISGTAGSADGSGTSATFNQPQGLVLMADGSLVVADTANGTLRTISTSGSVATLAGSAANRGSADGTGTSATFNGPIGIARDASGAIYVTDSMNDTIRKVVSGAVTTFAGKAGTTGSANGTGTAATFNFPTGVAVDTQGNLYISDTTNNVIREISPSGVVTTLAGIPGVAGSTDGAGTSATFNHPGGVSLDSSGNLYVADTGNSTIRKVTQTGTVSTVAGLPTVAGIEDGTGLAALFNQPKDLVVDSSGNIFVADTGNAAIRKITSTAVVSTMALTAVSSPPTTTTSNPTSTPPPTTSGGGSSYGGGGGGGAPSDWFLAGLALLTAGRALQLRRRRERA